MGRTLNRDLRQERRQVQDGISRTHILDAAERVFLASGFGEATLRDIAAEAQFSVGAIYNFFAGKEELFAKVMERKGQELLLELKEAVEGLGSAREKLHALAEAQTSFYGRHRDFYRLFIRTAGPSWWSLKAELDESAGERFSRAIDLEAAVIAEGIAAGEFRGEEAPDTLAVYFLGIVQAYAARWLFVSDAPSPDGEGVLLGTEESIRHLHELLDRVFLASDD